MANVLVVTNPFGGHVRGDRITDPHEIEQILEGEHASHVIRANHADVQTSQE
jgi:hypothetical protein